MLERMNASRRASDPMLRPKTATSRRKTAPDVVAAEAEALWIEFRRLQAEEDRCRRAFEAAQAAMPGWAQPGSPWLYPGNAVGDSDGVSYFPADERMGVPRTGRVLLRPSWDSLFAKHREGLLIADSSAAERFLVDAHALADRIRLMEQEEEKAGLKALEVDRKRVYEDHRQAKRVIADSAGLSVHHFAVSLLAELVDAVLDPTVRDVVATVRAGLTALYPQLSGGVAEAAKAVLASQGDGGLGLLPMIAESSLADRAA